MSDNKREIEREELHRSIWAIADELRGAVDGWDFKNYILGTMFYRYISENLCDYVNSNESKAGHEMNYAELDDETAELAKTSLIKEKGFFLLPSQLFENVRAKASSDNDLNETLQNVFDSIEKSAMGTKSEDDFKGLFDDYDVNSNKLGSTTTKRNERLKKLLDGVAQMNLGSFKNHDIDAFGDAYEYLMTMYASNAGKSGGEFFTPSDVSELLVRLGTVGRDKVRKVYDPACGSGSLLLTTQKVLGKGNVTDGFYGQEINITTYNLCRINMFLHDVGFENFDIQCEDTLTHPKHDTEAPFDLIVSNPPYSVKWEGKDNPLLINDSRFSPAGILAPKSKADLAFIMHSLSYLSNDGVAAIVCFPGIFYRDKAERKIRKYLIDNNYVDAVIELPENLFFGTTISTCILVLKKNKPTNDVCFINASREFKKLTNNNYLEDENIDHIVRLFNERMNVPEVCQVVNNETIIENDSILSVRTYIEENSNEPEIDIEELNSKIDEIVKNTNELRAEINELIKSIYKNTIIECVTENE